MRWNKSLVTNSLSVLLVVIGYVLPESWALAMPLRTIGLYAVSGAITNWIAIYMLFEKVPGFYGSGVIPNRFGEFKLGIKQLIMSEFFTHDNVHNFFASEAETPLNIDPNPVLEAIDYDSVFERLTAAIAQSSFGGMLAMFGGPKALAPLREPFEASIRKEIESLCLAPRFHAALRESIGTDQSVDAILAKVDGIVSQRLEQLTPQMVKRIVQDMISQHLGWLVVWGGVFGGLIGLVAYFLT